MSTNKQEQYAIKISNAIAEYFSEDGDGGSLNTDELTEFFTGYLIAMSGLYENLTQDRTDLIDFLSICNRLVFQYLFEYGKEEVTV